ncbi:MAG: molybdenum cofactor biosynthesis protein MoaB [Planctomycetaceae bacterium]|nr:molybdenum cofactor biosynthesis protein MoaB [Planctomycetaceae bacterium]MCP4816721.1 molybdenum cofactor biosynthesis protein MoaB [Planctomycetaceae bacterium]MEC9002177.1 molybdenum cofactor biosynthesis protein B [Planctomycetota bacterium]
MSSPADEHKAAAPSQLRCAVVTVSDTRTLETDSGGQLVVDLLVAAGHVVQRREIIPDDPEVMTPLLLSLQGDEEVEAILMTGGTGITSRDQTYETVTRLITRPIPGYGELLRMLSYEQVGAAAMLSRATAGLMEQTVVLTMPGSPRAVELAMEKIILPELCHLAREAGR